MSFEDAIRPPMVPLVSTIKANLSVGLLLDLQIYAKESFKTADQLRIESYDPYFQSVSQRWSDALRIALFDLPSFQIK